jgi:Tfp pilus assembly protein PilF
MPAPTAQQKLNMQLTMAGSLEGRGQRKEAIAAYSEIVKKDARNAAAHHRLAILYDREGIPQKAEEHYRLALKQRETAVILSDYGYSLYLQGRLAEAERMLRQSLAKDPTAVRTHGNLGLVLAGAGNHDEALHEFARAGCSEAIAHSNLGYVLLREKRFDEARAQFETAMAADPTSTAPREGLAALNVRALQTAPPANEIARNETSTAPAKAVAYSSTSAQPGVSAQEPAADEEVSIAPCGFSM